MDKQGHLIHSEHLLVHSVRIDLHFGRRSDRELQSFLPSSPWLAIEFTDIRTFDRRVSLAAVNCRDTVTIAPLCSSQIENGRPFWGLSSQHLCLHQCFHNWLLSHFVQRTFVWTQCTGAVEC